MASKEVTAEDVDFVKTELQHEPLFLRWMTKKKLTRMEERLFVVGNYRIISISKTRLGSKSIRRNSHLFDITEINSPFEGKLLIVTKEWRIEFAGEYVEELLQTLIRAYGKLTYNWPPSSKMNRFITPETRIPMCVDPGYEMDGFAQIYAAYCNYFQAPFQADFVKFVKETTDPDSRILSLSEYPYIRHIVGDKHLDLRTIGHTLKFNRYFKGVRLYGITQQADALSELSEPLSTNATITYFSLSGLVAQAGYDILGRALSLSNYSALQEIDLSGNMIKDAGIIHMIPGIAKLQLRYLDISRCEISSRGISALANLFRTTPILSESLVAVNLSHNRINETASKSIMEWLDSYKSGKTALRTLLLGKTGFDVSCIGSNASLHIIEILDVSGNKITNIQAESMVAYLERSNTIQDIDLSGCIITEQALFAIVKAIVSNESIKKSMIDLSLIPMNPSYAYNLSLAFAANKNLHTICLDESGIKTRGLLQLLSPLMQIKTLRRLHIGKIVKMKSNNRVNVVRKLVQYINSTQLEALHIDGDDNAHIGLELIPLIELFAENTTITELNITGQQTGDEGLAALSKALGRNRVLKKLYCDGQGASLTGFAALAEGLEACDNVLNLSYPVIDLSKIKSAEQRILVTEKLRVIQTIIRRNRDKSGKPKPRISYSAHDLGRIEEDTDETAPIPHIEEGWADQTGHIDREINRMSAHSHRASGKATGDAYTPTEDNVTTSAKRKSLVDLTKSGRLVRLALLSQGDDDDEELIAATPKAS